MKSLSERQSSTFAPFAVMIAFLLIIFLSYVAKGFVGLSFLSPWLLPAAVFYWIIFRPTFCGNFLIFLLGIFEDGLAGTPFGLHAVGLLILGQLAYYQRHYLEHNPFPVIWTAYIINTIVMYAVMAFLMFLAGVKITPWVLGTWFIGVIFFPVIYALMGRLHLALTEDD